MPWKERMTIDIGNKCVSWFKDTSFGSGRFVNRIPAGTDKYEGYQCPECQMIECDECHKETLEYFVCNKTASIYCDNCNEKLGLKLKWKHIKNQKRKQLVNYYS